MFYLVLGFYPILLEFLSSCEISNHLRLLVLFGPKVLSASIGIYFKLWVFKPQLVMFSFSPNSASIGEFLFLFYLVLRFYPIILEFLSSCEFSSRFYFLFYLVLKFYPLILEFLSSCEFSSSFGFLFYFVLRFYPLVLEFISSCEFSASQSFMFYLVLGFYPIKYWSFFQVVSFQAASASCFILS